VTTAEFRTYQEQTFDSFCKAVIRNESIDAHRELAAKANREVQLSSLNENDPAFRMSDETCDYCRIYYVMDRPVTIHNYDLGESLQYISPHRRDVILLFYFLEYSDREIADMLGTSKDAVRIRKTAALRRLRTLMGDNKND